MILKKLKGVRRVLTTYALIVVMAIATLTPQVVGFAQTNTPIPPTATMVRINVPVNIILTETNTWIATFAPIAAIGIGITIALAVLGYIGSIIKSAFGGSR